MKKKKNSGNTNTHNFRKERCSPGITAAVLRKRLLVRVSSSEINRNHVSICHGFVTPGELGEPKKPAGPGAWKPWDPRPGSVWISNEPLQPPPWQDAWPASKLWLELGLQADCYRDGGQNKVRVRASKASLLLAQVGSQNPSQPLAPGLLVQGAVLELWALGAWDPRQKPHSNATAAHQDQGRACQVWQIRRKKKNPTFLFVLKLTNASILATGMQCVSRKYKCLRLDKDNIIISQS